MATEVAETFEYEEPVEAAAPVVQAAELPDIKLFGRWSCDDVQVSDMSLQVRSIENCSSLFTKTHSGFLNYFL